MRRLATIALVSGLAAAAVQPANAQLVGNPDFTILVGDNDEGSQTGTGSTLIEVFDFAPNLVQLTFTAQDYEGEQFANAFGLFLDPDYANINTIIPAYSSNTSVFLEGNAFGVSGANCVDNGSSTPVDQNYECGDGLINNPELIIAQSFQNVEVISDGNAIWIDNPPPPGGAGNTTNFSNGDIVSFLLYGDGLTPSVFHNTATVKTPTNSSSPYTLASACVTLGGIPVPEGGDLNNDSGVSCGTTITTPPPLVRGVPGPLPLFGLFTAFGYTRKLRSRISSNQ